jgi:hypothetical protein
LLTLDTLVPPNFSTIHGDSLLVVIGRPGRERMSRSVPVEARLETSECAPGSPDDRVPGDERY